VASATPSPKQNKRRLAVRPSATTNTEETSDNGAAAKKKKIKKATNKGKPSPDRKKPEKARDLSDSESEATTNKLFEDDGQGKRQRRR
jgi:hypothetical protein